VSGSNVASHSPEDALSFVRIEDVAFRLGVSVRHIRRLVAGRRIPYIKIGRLLRFDPQELAAWLATARVAVRDDQWV